MGFNLHLPSQGGRRLRASSQSSAESRSPVPPSQLRERQRSLADKGEKVTDATPEDLRDAACTLIQGRVPRSSRGFHGGQGILRPPPAVHREPAAPLGGRPRNGPGAAAQPGRPSTHSGGRAGERRSVAYRTRVRVGSWRRRGEAPAPGTRLASGCARRVLYYFFAAAAATCQRERRKRRRRRRQPRQANLAGLMGNSREMTSAGPASSRPCAGGGRQPERRERRWRRRH